MCNAVSAEWFVRERGQIVHGNSGNAQMAVQ